jgi:hypothetical protein
MHIEDTQRLFAEIEMLKVVLSLVGRSKKEEKEKMEPKWKSEEQVKKVTGLHNKII